MLKWSKTRRRYERQGLLVESEALEQAENECKADAKQREVRRINAAIRRDELDKVYIKQFSARIRELYPNCPSKRELKIAEHACRKYSGRVGRSSAAKSMDAKAVRLAVMAHIRHVETNYDDLLAAMHERGDARMMVRDAVAEILNNWQ